jgi:hypothetical protein
VCVLIKFETDNRVEKLNLHGQLQHTQGDAARSC